MSRRRLLVSVGALVAAVGCALATPACSSTTTSSSGDDADAGVAGDQRPDARAADDPTLDAGTGDGDAADPDGGNPQPGQTKITNTPNASCVTGTPDSVGSDASNPDEHEAWTVARLTPPTYPFSALAIDYDLVANSNGCDVNIPHRVRVFKGTSAVPIASPVDVLEMSVSHATPVLTTTYHQIVALPSPVTLQSGESLFVAVEMKVVGASENCILVCRGEAGQRDRNYWTDSDDAPSAWSTLASYGIPENIRVEASGQSF